MVNLDIRTSLSSPRREQNLDEFCDYLFETYISEESIFPPQIWYSKPRNLLTTINACESFHAVLKSNFYHPHPQISNFLEILKGQIPTLKSALLDQESVPGKKFKKKTK
jgi:hypothetical protein